MAKRTYPIRTEMQRAQLARDAARAPDNWYAVLVEGTRSIAQNAKLHAMLTDIQRQVPDMREYSLEDMKLRFMDAFGAEMRFLPKLSGQGLFPVGLRTSTLTVSQFADLIEFLNVYGAEQGVIWSDEARKEAA